MSQKKKEKIGKKKRKKRKDISNAPGNSLKHSHIVAYSTNSTNTAGGPGQKCKHM